jgi:peptidoglycan-N-acetylglucosamine deacetylase
MLKPLMISLTLLSSTFSTSPLQVHSEPTHLRDSYTKPAQLYEQPPVDAKVDRVWRAIPGLSGWKLDVAESQRITAKAHDGKRHLKWTLVPPTRRLSDLPSNPIYRATDREKSACLMFNVSWGEAYVPKLLQTLKQQGVRATFFLDGAWVKQNPALAKQIAADGHVIGSHGMGHPNFQKLSDSALQRQVTGTNQVIRNTVGVQPRLLAPPGGAFDTRTVQLARHANMFTILWTVDSIDWRKPPSAVILERVMGKMEPGALILMHPTEPTADALGPLIQALKNKGYHLKTVEQVVNEERVVVPPSTLRD